MNGDTPATTMAALPPRAAVAVLSMQLRTAIQEAEDAEALEAAGQHDAARVQLRERLTRLTADRRRSLDDALTAARNDAEAAIAAARRTAEAMMDKAPAPFEAQRAVAMEPLVPVEVSDEIEPSSHAPTETLSNGLAETPIETPIETPVETVGPPQMADVTAASLAASLSVRETSAVALPTANVMIDAEGFARVFATVLASLLDERLGTLGSTRPIILPAPAVPPAPVKQSFWTHARHPDVLLMGLTMVIVLVVLAAWLA